MNNIVYIIYCSTTTTTTTQLIVPNTTTAEQEQAESNGNVLYETSSASAESTHTAEHTALLTQNKHGTGTTTLTYTL